MDGSSRFGLTAAAFSAFILVAFSALALPRTAYIIGRVLSWTPVDKGNLFSSYGVGFILGAVLTGSLSGLLGRKMLILVALVLSLSGHFFFASGASLSFAYRYQFLLLVNGVIGGGIGMLEGVLNALIVDLHQHRPSLFLNLGHGFFSLGAAIGPVIAGLLLPVGWQWVYYLNAMLSGVLLSAFACTSWSGERRPARLQFRQVRWLVRQGVFLLALISIFFVVGAELGLTAWVVEFVRTRGAFTVGDVGAGLFLTYFALAMLVGRVFYGFAAERTGAPWALLVSALGAAVSLVFFIMSGSLAVSIFAVVLYGLFLSGMIATLIAYACERFPRAAGTVSGLMTAAIGSGAAVFPNIIGHVAPAAGLALGLWICAGSLLLVGLLMLRFVGQRA